MPLDPLDWPDRLNLGCGFDHREGYLNVDLHEFHEPDIVADAQDLVQLPSGHYRHVLAQNLLEHLPRTATAAVLAQWNRLLAPGGILTLRVPSLLDAVARLARPERQALEQQEALIRDLYGTQGYPGDALLTGFTRPLLEARLRAEGFEPRRWELIDDWQFDLDAEKVGPSAYAQTWAPYGELLALTDVDEFLAAAYRRLLGRAPDRGGADHFRTLLQTGGTSRREVLATLLASEEARAHRGGSPPHQA